MIYSTSCSFLRYGCCWTNNRTNAYGKINFYMHALYFCYKQARLQNYVNDYLDFLGCVYKITFEKVVHVNIFCLSEWSLNFRLQHLNKTFHFQLIWYLQLFRGKSLISLLLINSHSFRRKFFRKTQSRIVQTWKKNATSDEIWREILYDSFFLWNTKLSSLLVPS